MTQKQSNAQITQTPAQQELDLLKAEYDEFISIASHDLYGNFRQVLAFSEIILNQYKDSFDAETQTYFTYIINGAKDGKQKLDELRAFSKIQKSNFTFTDIDCTALVADVIDTLTALTDPSEVDITVGKLPVIQADSDKMREVFHNLLENALLYREGTRAHKISVTCDETDSFFEFKIADNGMGIADYLDQSIFQAFKRGVAKDQYPGRGMGLAIAKKIVNLHGGKLDYLREPENKTVFRFTVPKISVAA